MDIWTVTGARGKPINLTASRTTEQRAGAETKRNVCLGKGRVRLHYKPIRFRAKLDVRNDALALERKFLSNG
jgi:hypothetical protein